MKRSTFITWDQLKVGALILAAIGILTIAVVKLGEAADLFTKRYTLVTFLSNSNGLQKGGSVTLAGQLAGNVKRIDFLPPSGDTTRNLRVTLEVESRLSNLIREDSRIKLKSLGLLGDKVLDISPGTPRFAVLPAGRHDPEPPVARLRGDVDAGQRRAHRCRGADARSAGDYGRHRARRRHDGTADQQPSAVRSVERDAHAPQLRARPARSSERHLRKDGRRSRAL